MSNQKRTSACLCECLLSFSLSPSLKSVCYEGREAVKSVPHIRGPLRTNRKWATLGRTKNCLSSCWPLNQNTPSTSGPVGVSSDVGEKRTRCCDQAKGESSLFLPLFLSLKRRRAFPPNATSEDYATRRVASLSSRWEFNRVN